MNFEYKTKTVSGAPITLVFKPYGDAPGRIARHNVNNIEAQFWQYLEWGLLEPKIWPEGSPNPGVGVFDEIAQRHITLCYNAWQEATPSSDSKSDSSQDDDS